MPLKKQRKREKRDIPQRKQPQNAKAQRKSQGGLEKKKHIAMIEKELEKVKGKRKEKKFKNYAQKNEIQQEIQESHKMGH